MQGGNAGKGYNCKDQIRRKEGESKVFGKEKPCRTNESMVYIFGQRHPLRSQYVDKEYVKT